jgi:peptidoglycan hydrolase CwlO-like protein
MEGRTILTDVAAAISAASFWVPEYVCPSGWIEHAPFAFWICDALRPRRFVELGTHHGYSYFAFCQAIGKLGLGTTAYAVDTWKGDEHAGFYDENVFRSVAARNKEKYAAFSSLMRATFEEALDYFADGSIDLLHIDGRHFYDDLKHDFTMWRPKLTEGAVVLFHDTNVREREFGVWKFFEETAAEHPSFQFFHGHGLGVLALGDRAPAPLAPLFQASSESADQIRSIYATLGGALTPRRALSAKSEAISFLLTNEAGASGAVAEAVAQISDYDDQVQQVRGALETRDSMADQLRAQIEQQAATEAALRAEIEQCAATEAALRAEIEQCAATEAALRAEIEQRAATEAALRAEIEQRGATEAALRAEIEQRAVTETVLRSALDEAERDARNSYATVEAARAEITTIQDALAKADRSLQERADAADALQAELEVLGGELREAERRGQQSEAGTVALQAQIKSLQNELAAAREVGRAALEAVRYDIAVPSEASPQNSVWRAPVLRRFGFRARDQLSFAPAIAHQSSSV